MAVLACLKNRRVLPDFIRAKRPPDKRAPMRPAINPADSRQTIAATYFNDQHGTDKPRRRRLCSQTATQ
ncbi:hypothetical protein, partial [Mesorhizobium sp. M7A.F.Ca.CA.001.05.1.1]|uniref:hypothetical protein n=1 Tax=Mesorhizobium sp. M7A.F.Ca.CA.001.05.1.1 TaxID=2496721 RepID=UPI0019CF9B3D